MFNSLAPFLTSRTRSGMILISNSWINFTCMASPHESHRLISWYGSLLAYGFPQQTLYIPGTSNALELSVAAPSQLSTSPPQWLPAGILIGCVMICSPRPSSGILVEPLWLCISCMLCVCKTQTMWTLSSATVHLSSVQASLDQGSSCFWAGRLDPGKQIDRRLYVKRASL